jgi:hypothetical protein
MRRGRSRGRRAYIMCEIRHGRVREWRACGPHISDALIRRKVGLPNIGVSMTFNATKPPGVNSDWPTSHSIYATLQYLEDVNRRKQGRSEPTYRVRSRFNRVRANVLLPDFLWPFMRYTPVVDSGNELRAVSQDAGKTNGWISLLAWLI